MASEDLKSEFESAVSDASSSLSECSEALSSLREAVSKLDAYAINLPTRLEALRSRGFVYRAGLEKQLEKLIDGWMKVRRDFLASVEEAEERFSPQIESLRRELDSLRMIFEPKSGDLEKAKRLKLEAENLLRTIKNSVDELLASVEALSRSFSSVEGAVSHAEYALNELGRSKVQLREGEHVVGAFRVKLLGDDKRKGYFYVTSERLIFEEEREEVLKKVLFIATKKRKIREVALEFPIGYVKDASPGRVGFFAGKGVYITLTDGRALTFDMDDYLVDSLIRDINYVLSGEADRDRVDAVPEAGGLKIKVIKCPYCGAPVRVQLVRGLRSVTCEYCGSTIAIQQ